MAKMDNLYHQALLSLVQLNSLTARMPNTPIPSLLPPLRMVVQVFLNSDLVLSSHHDPRLQDLSLPPTGPHLLLQVAANLHFPTIRPAQQTCVRERERKARQLRRKLRSHLVSMPHYAKTRSTQTRRYHKDRVPISLLPNHHLPIHFLLPNP